VTSLSATRVLAGLLAATALVAPAYAQHPNVRMSTPGNTPEEMTIAVDPANPTHLAAGANLSYVYRSFTTGASWTEGTMSSTLGVAGDPVTLYDVEGNLYYVHLSSPITGDWLDRMVVQRSGDGGATWTDGAGVGLNPPRDQDKPGIAADGTSSAYRDNLYLAWTEFDTYGSGVPGDSTRILFSRSTDFGTTWSPPLRVNEASGNCLDSDDTVEGAIPAIGPQGQVYLAWSGPGGIWCDRSLDGGVTFGSDVFVATQPGGWDFDVPGLGRANGLPTTLCDASTSPFRGRVYVMWSDQRAGTGDTDVFVARSSDGGQTWSAPVRVNTDATATHQFFPAAALDPVSGILYVLYYDRHATTGNATDVYLSRSADGGQTFQSVRLSDTSFTPNTGVFFGDYLGITAWNRRVHADWMRMDGNALSAWTATVADSAVFVSVPAPSPPSVLLFHAAAPNPLAASTRLSYRLAAGGRVTARIFDLQGREIATLFDGWQEMGEHDLEWDARSRSPGLYLYRVAIAGAAYAGKLVVAR